MQKISTNDYIKDNECKIMVSKTVAPNCLGLVNFAVGIVDSLFASQASEIPWENHLRD